MMLYNALSKVACTTMAALLVTGCSNPEPTKPTQHGGDRQVADASATAKHSIGHYHHKASAVLKGLKDNKIKGSVTFTKQQDGVLIIADVEGLTPGKHGFHIHEHGDCSSVDGMSVGGHFDPTHSKHGGPDSTERHVGDLGNIEADASGKAHYQRVDRVIRLHGKDTIIGRSIVIHADADDLTSQPAGNSGARIACGVIMAE